MEYQRPLLSTKLKIPQPRKNYIIRTELYYKLDMILEYNAFVIKGGAGSGKTTLITSYLKEHTILAKWITLDENCNNAFTFWSYFVEAMKDVLTDSFDDLFELFNSNYQKSNLEQILVFLINNLCEKEEIIFILDDFQSINEEFLLSTIRFFLENIPDNVHIIILTREELGFYYALLEMEGRLIYLDESNLKLTKEESVQFLKQTLSLKLKDETLEYMANLSSGWIGGLQLIASSTQGKSDEEVVRLKFTNRLLGEYISHEIFLPLSEGSRDFLVRTSMLSYFSKEVSEKLIDNLDFTNVMSEVLGRNLLIIHVDEEKGIYRYHTILSEFLKSRFKQFPKKEQLVFYKKSAFVFEEIKDYEECLNHHLAVDNYQDAMRIILKMPQSGVTFSYFDKIPIEEMVQNTDFACQCFFYFYGNFDVERCRKLYSLIEEKMGDDDVFKAFYNCNMFVKDNITLEDYRGYNKVDIENLPLQGNTKAFLFIKDASLLLTQGKYIEALYLIEKAEEVCKDKNNPYFQFFNLSIKAQIYEEKGELKKCYPMYEAMDTLLNNEDKISMLKASYHIGIVGVYLKQLNFKKAKEHLTQIESIINDKKIHNLFSVDKAYQYNIVIFYFLTEDTNKAMELLDDLATIDVYKETINLAYILKSVLWNTDFTSEYGVRFLRDFEKYMDEKDSHLKLDNYSLNLYADYLIQDGRCKEGVVLIDTVLKRSRKEKAKYSIVEAALLKIYAFKKEKNSSKDVINLFHEAIYHSYDNHIMLPYWFDKGLVNSLVKEYEVEIERDFSEKEKEFLKMEVLRTNNLSMDEIDDRSGVCDDVKVAAQILHSSAETKIGTSEILSNRELEVLREISTGATNKEIAKRLYISVSTVKTHIISIYSKLQVNSRVLAVDEGVKQGLL